jgi:hypothetical protein
MREEITYCDICEERINDQIEEVGSMHIWSELYAEEDEGGLLESVEFQIDHACFSCTKKIFKRMESAIKKIKKDKEKNGTS